MLNENENNDFANDMTNETANEIASETVDEIANETADEIAGEIANEKVALEVDLQNVKTLSGVVVSDKMKDTIVVLVERSVKHPKYGKRVKKSSKIKAHDPGNIHKIGDVVTIKECRPLSKTKAWKVVRS